MRKFHKQIIPYLPYSVQKCGVNFYLKRKKLLLNKLRTPTTLIFFVTSRCNARCAHCFYWQELNTNTDELKIHEIENIAKSFSQPLHLSLTGGEPFLRNDLYEICNVFYKFNQCRNLSIASNGYLNRKIIEFTDNILTKLEFDKFSIQISLDGLESTHDNIRGVKNGFKQALNTISELSMISNNYINFNVNVSFTVQKRNIDNALSLIDLLIPYRVPIKFALVRGANYGTYALSPEISSDFDPKEEDSSVVDIDTLEKLFAQINEKNLKSPYRFWSERQQEKIRLSLKMMKEKKKQLPCYAGLIDGVLYANGDVALCELTQPLGNMKYFNYDFERIWKSKQADDFRSKIKKCFCIHGCNLTTSMMFNPDIILSTIKK